MKRVAKEKVSGHAQWIVKDHIISRPVSLEGGAIY